MPLTAAEALVAAGRADVEIAALLSISPRTVHHTLARVYRKLGVANRVAAAAKALEAAHAGAIA